MAPAGAVPGFLPSRDALHFANSWPSQPDVVIDLPVSVAYALTGPDIAPKVDQAETLQSAVGDGACPA